MLNLHASRSVFQRAFAGLGLGLAAVCAPAYAELGDQLFKLLANDGEAGDEFGGAAGISDTTAIVGAGHPHPFGAAYLFDITTGQQLFKLTANDAQESQNFGFEVAISGTIAIVGDRGNDSGGTNAGAAYLFDTTTGQQLFKLTANDAEAQDRFGSSVAISGTIAIVGAEWDDTVRNDPLSKTGSAYLFDTTSGQQLLKLTASDGAHQDQFGWSVAISGATAIVGARSPDDNFDTFGAAYLFDTATGQQIAKLLPDGEHQGFSLSVAISGATAVVGAHADNGNTGAAYLFDATNGIQIAKITADDAATGDQFGFSVAISGTLVVVGATTNDDNGNASGSAYIFDISNDATGTQIAKLLPDDGAASDAFGHSVGIGGATALVGAIRHDDNGGNSGSAYLFETGLDTDGDGLLDSWETGGIPYTAVDGSTKYYILDSDGDGFTDADPLIKDLFVELDHMQGLSFSQNVVSDLEGAFFVAPEQINLHLVVDDGTIPFEQETVTPDHPDFPGSPTFPADAAEIKNLFFGTLAEQINTDAVPLLEAKAKAYRYCIFYNKASTAIGGLGELGGDDTIIFAGGYSDVNKASVFMHELGHNLGLDHGGGDSVNGKPNYPSIMNYVLAYKAGWSATFWRLDYSREQLATLDEFNLNELTSVGEGGSGFYSAFEMPYFGIVPDNAHCFPPGDWLQAVVEYASLDPSWLTDFNLDCDECDPIVVSDLNFLPNSGLPGTVTPSLGESLVGYNDWANIVLPLSDSGGPFAGPVPTDELTETQVQYMEDNFPPPPGAPNPVASPMLTAIGPRYLEVIPAAGKDEVALLVTSDDEPCVSLYVQSPETINGHVIGRLGESAVLLTPTEWGTVNVSDEAILPGTSYTIRSELADAGLSDPTAATTWAWADANNSDIPVDFDDILCVLEGFAGNFAGACSFFGSDIEGGVTNVIIDFDDVLAALDAFAGDDYFDNPTHVDPCP